MEKYQYHRFVLKLSGHAAEMDRILLFSNKKVYFMSFQRNATELRIEIEKLKWFLNFQNVSCVSTTTWHDLPALELGSENNETMGPTKNMPGFFFSDHVLQNLTHEFLKQVGKIKQTKQIQSDARVQKICICRRR